MKRIETEELCCKSIKQSQGRFIYNIKPCGKKATYTNGSHFFCREHSKMGRYVIRNGEVGEILERFDTEQEMRDNLHRWPGMKMQKINPNSRRDFYPHHY